MIPRGDDRHGHRVAGLRHQRQCADHRVARIAEEGPPVGTSLTPLGTHHVHAGSLQSDRLGDRGGCADEGTTLPRNESVTSRSR